MKKKDKGMTDWERGDSSGLKCHKEGSAFLHIEECAEMLQRL